MQGTMMDYHLTLNHILERAGRLFPRVEIVSRLPDRPRGHLYKAAAHGRRSGPSLEEERRLRGAGAVVREFQEKGS